MNEKSQVLGLAGQDRTESHILELLRKKQDNDSMGVEYVDIGECAGHFRLITRRAYDEVYNRLLKMLHEQGAAAVLEYNGRCWRGELDLSPRDDALIRSIIQVLPGRQVSLRAAKEFKLKT